MLFFFFLYIYQGTLSWFHLKFVLWGGKRDWKGHVITTEGYKAKAIYEKDYISGLGGEA